jgi:hypothetical protein
MWNCNLDGVKEIIIKNEEQKKQSRIDDSKELRNKIRYIEEPKNRGFFGGIFGMEM